MSASPTVHTPRQVAGRRASRPHSSMFVRMLIRAAFLRRGRAASALFAMVVAAAVATAMMNLYVDVQANLRTEFTRARQLNHWWNVSHWPETTNSAAERRNSLAQRESAGNESPSTGVPSGTALPALVGMRAATVVTPDRKPFELTFQGRTLQLAPVGLLQTGAGEDSRIYLDQSEFHDWTGVAPSTIEIAINGSTAEIEKQIAKLTQSLPTADVRPVRQIMEGEANVLNKTRATLYAAATLIVLTSALCVLATLMGWVFDRRRDFALMKALGASEHLINGFFAAEAAALGVVGAVLGFFIGIGIAAWIGRVNFHAPVVPRFSVFPYVLAGSVI